MKNIIILIFVLGTTLTSIANNINNEIVSDKENTSYQIGDKIADFSLPNTDGKLVSLSDYEDAKGYVIVFTCNVCPFAVANEERLIQMHNNMAQKGYPVIAINPNEGDQESMKAMKNKVTELNIPFAYLKDSDAVYEKFGATKTPQVFLVDNNMTLQYTGSIDDSPRSPENVEESYLLDAIDDLMNNRKPEPSVTKSIGCSIKRGANAGGKGRKGPPNPKAILERMDEDKDNKISKSEAKGPLVADFDRLDIDKDGQLTTEELTKIKPRKKKTD